MEDQLQNPIEEHQIDPNNDYTETDTKPFSMRQYVWAIRQEDIIRSWPFPVKYLEICLKHGIKHILPSFDPHEPLPAPLSLCGGIGLNCAPEVNVGAAKSRENKTTLVVGQTQEKPSKSEVLQEDRFESFDGSGSKCEKESSNDHFSSDFSSAVVVPSNYMSSPHLIDESYVSLTSTKRPRYKRRKRNQKHKKRSMADILAVAKHCNLGDLYKHQESSNSSIKCDDDY